MTLLDLEGLLFLYVPVDSPFHRALSVTNLNKIFHMALRWTSKSGKFVAKDIIRSVPFTLLIVANLLPVYVLGMAWSFLMSQPWTWMLETILTCGITTMPRTTGRILSCCPLAIHTSRKLVSTTKFVLAGLISSHQFCQDRCVKIEDERKNSR